MSTMISYDPTISRLIAMVAIVHNDQKDRAVNIRINHLNTIIFTNIKMQ